MVLTPTTQIPLGYKAPDFNLLNPLIGKNQSLNALKSNYATIVIFMCNHCPYVVHVLDGLVKLANDYMSKEITVIGINANDIINYPDDSPEKMIDLIHEYNIPFPYLFDSTQQVAKLYNAACTPDFSVFNGNMECVYRGQLDDSRPGNNEPVTGSDIRLVLDAILTNTEITSVQKPSVGCNIKWK
ncbi:MAG: thioredoxin family protein [Flavobacteriales bacterium]|nr:thioredoxin family protein [Flavobacteriales bacterium]|tara:strand:- start:4010 stop:4564 length:555 start_codon:yes stop_codon:yes gene_type:complete